MSQDTLVISLIALVIVIGSCIGLARAGKNARSEE